METTDNINNAFGQGIANERAVQWWVKKFRQGDKSVEDEDPSGQPLEVDNDQLKIIIKVDPLNNYMRSCLKQCQPLYSHLAFKENWKGEKA